jgi:hypothetical protein
VRDRIIEMEMHWQSKDSHAGKPWEDTIVYKKNGEMVPRDNHGILYGLWYNGTPYFAYLGRTVKLAMTRKTEHVEAGLVLAKDSKNVLYGFMRKVAEWREDMTEEERRALFKEQCPLWSICIIKKVWLPDLSGTDDKKKSEAWKAMMEDFEKALIAEYAPSRRLLNYQEVAPE